MTPIETFEQDIANHNVELSSAAWSLIRQSLSEINVKARDCIYRQHNIGDRWLFLTNGIVASRQTNIDGTLSIARFFEPSDFCANLTSTWKKDYAGDELIALTNVTGIEVPDHIFRHEFLSGGDFGLYLRLKLMATLCFDKELICVKTNASTEARYRFLEQHQSSIIESVQQKDVAAFLGVTPQGLSRFLKKRNGRN